MSLIHPEILALSEAVKELQAQSAAQLAEVRALRQILIGYNGDWVKSYVENHPLSPDEADRRSGFLKEPQPSTPPPPNGNHPQE